MMSRRHQIGSGMRGGKRRTYRFQDDTVVDHVTGKPIQVSKAMKGDACPLIQVSELF
jgi:protein subunit release factor A